MTEQKSVQPTRIEKHSPTEMLLAWNTGEQFAVSFVDLRYLCPCASCVDENTGERVIERSSIGPDIRPTGVSIVGRYAVQIIWSDLHSTGMFSFDRLYEICHKMGRRLG